MATTASRYDTILKLAAGGMATVWIGTVRGALGFRQLVAIKKPHPHLLAQASFRQELVAEARLASMIHHANVVDVRDVEIEGEEISLVMDYIEGASLGEMIVAANKAGTRLAPRVAVRIALDALAGLHAAHELVDEKGRFVGLVHRDVSPQNILVGSDGMARVADFGVAKFSRKNMASTSDGSLKGKLAYMAPEYVRGEAIDRRFDVFAMGVVLWETIAGRRCFRGDNEAETLNRLLTHAPDPLSKVEPAIGEALDAVLACALSKEKDDRFGNAAAMAAALEASALANGLLCGHSEVATAVKELAGAAIEERRTLVRAKLANEPSVASLLGVPFGDAGKTDANGHVALPGAGTTAPMPDAPVPPTVVQLAGKTEEMPATAAASTESGPYAPPDASAAKPRAATVAAASAIPATTLPMTPRMEVPPELARIELPGRTLASPGAATPMGNAAPIVATLPVAGSGVPPPMIAATHLSAGVAPAPAAIPATLSDAPPANLPPAKAQAAPALSDSYGDAPPPPPQKRWVLPVVVGVMTAIVATIAILYVMKPPNPTVEPIAPVPPPPTPTTSVHSTPTASGTAATASATATSASSTAPAISASSKPGGKPPKGARGTTGASTTAEPTGKAPPPNPYAD